MKDSSINYSDLCDTLIRIFRSQRDFILSHTHTKIEYQTKSDSSYVTEVDRAVEKNVTSMLAVSFPNIAVYGEESGYKNEDLPQSYLLIDPIDGTSSYIKGIPAYTCMAVYIERGEALVSVVYNPSTDDVFHAIKGQGAYKNGARLQLEKKKLPQTVYAKGRFISELDKLIAPLDLHAEKGPSGAGFGFSLVAEGSIAARCQLQSRGQLHDYATGALLVLEAGGCIVPVLDHTYSIYSKSFVACHPDFAKVVTDNLGTFREFDSAIYTDKSS